MLITKRHLTSWLGISALALTLANCVTTAVKEPRVVCKTEHGLSFTTGYDQGEVKCVTDRRDEGAILATVLSRGGGERFWLRVFTRNKENPSERISDITPESLIKDIEDGYARDGDTKYPYRLENEAISAVDLNGTKATLRERNLIINGYLRPVNYLFFETGAFEYAVVLTPSWRGVTETNAKSMTQEIIHSLAVE